MEQEVIELGIIGFGDMGKLYAKAFKRAGWKKINICDIPSKYDELLSKYGSEYNVCEDGFAVTRRSDFTIFSVEAANIEKVVSMYGPSMKLGAIASGQTSVKYPEVAAFKKYLPSDINIVTCHSLHGPSVNPKGQPLVIIRVKSCETKFNLAVNILNSLESNIVYLTADEHDQITADTQAVTHLAFLSMGTAWKTTATYPWEDPKYIGGIENVKTLISLRIYGNKWHVYAGLVLLNPFALEQVHQYARSVSELFKLMIQEKENDFKKRIHEAKQFVFQKVQNQQILLSDSLLDQFSLSAIPKELRKPNSHLSLLAIVDCWEKLKIQPYDHLICQTPPFRLLLGIAEYLFRTDDLLEEAIHSALFHKEIRADDCEFFLAAQGWVECIELGSMDAYRKRFENTATFFHERAPSAQQLTSQLLEKLK